MWMLFIRIYLRAFSFKSHCSFHHKAFAYAYTCIKTSELVYVYVRNCASQVYVCKFLMFLCHIVYHSWLYIYIYIYIYMYIHTYIRTCIHAYIHTCMHTYIHTYIHMYICVCVYICIYIYMLESIHALIRTSMHA
jgi:hypothetical protein